MRFRAARESDLATCLTLFHPAFVIPPAVKEHLVAIWRDLLAEERCTFSIVEDPSRPHPDSIEGFGVSIFVTDQFAERLRAPAAPMTATQLYEALLAGRPVVAPPSEIRARNSGNGLNVFVAHFGLRNHDLSRPQTAQALQTGSASFYFFHSGYRITALFNEVFGEQAAHYMKAGGFKLTTDFPDWTPAHPDEEATHRPYLFALRKEDMAPGAINPLSFLFYPPDPVLGFSPAEQRILIRALQGETDVQIAEMLAVSRDAIKKAWGRIYDRVTTVAPYVLGIDEPRRGPHRSLEKRRHLLEYLRGHLEELRPRTTPRRSRAVSPSPADTREALDQA